MGYEDNIEDAIERRCLEEAVQLSDRRLMEEIYRMLRGNIIRQQNAATQAHTEALGLTADSDSSRPSHRLVYP